MIAGGTITATGGNRYSDIGSTCDGVCGTITITSGVTSVTATKGNNTRHSIGTGFNGSCGTVTIGCTIDGNGMISGGNVGAIGASPYT